jgi:hypothetical protein
MVSQADFGDRMLSAAKWMGTYTNADSEERQNHGEGSQDHRTHRDERRKLHRPPRLRQADIDKFTLHVIQTSIGKGILVRSALCIT